MWFPFIAGNGSTVVAGTWASQSNITQQYIPFFTQNATSHTDADEIKWKVSLPKGTYTYYFYSVKDSNMGKVDLYVGTTKIASGIDLYAGASAYNSVSTGTFSLTSDAENADFRIVVNGKNGASSSYCAYITACSFIRTGA